MTIMSKEPLVFIPPNIAGIPFVVDEKKELELTVVTCPNCHGLFGVDSSFLDQVSNTVHCSMCLYEIYIAD